MIGAKIARINLVLVGLLALLAVLGLALAMPALTTRLQLLVFDTYQRLGPWEGPESARVALVDIDEPSIRSLGQWPWPRPLLARLTQRLGKAGAAAIAYDIVFSEPDRTSPEVLASTFSDPALGAALKGLPRHDALLAQSFADVPVVLGYFFLAPGKGGDDVAVRAPFTLSGTLPSRAVPTYAKALLPLAPLREAAAGMGFVTLQGDADGIVRRVPLVAIQNRQAVPGLALEALRLAEGVAAPHLIASDGSGESLAAPGSAVAVRLGARTIPLNDAGEMWLHFPRRLPGPVLSAGAIISGALSDAALAEAVKGRIVFVGGSAEGLQDLVATPLSPNVAGVSAHAIAAEQVRAGHFLERPDWARALELVLALLLGGVFALVLPRLGAAIGLILALAGMAGVVLASWLSFTRAGYLFDPVLPLLAILAVYGVQTVLAFYREEMQRRYIHAAFDRYLSPELVRQIAADPGRLELGGEERDMTVLMCDIRGFSHISESLAPREVIGFLTAFLTPMSDVLLAHKATLDKYIGDAILAFWNAPLDDPDHPAHAARAALAMVARLETLNREMAAQQEIAWPGPVAIGIGLNSGLCCVGNMGSRERLSYTLIGDTVNVAARLEGLTKAYGVPIILGENLAQRLGHFALLELDRVRVVGRDQPLTIFALLGDETLAQAPEMAALVAAHGAMLTAYRQQEWARAEALLDEAREAYEARGLGPLRALFAARIAALAANPPGPQWDGVFQAREK